jgi:DNA-binding transcriptional regulator YdaS (Cro superfamily)
MDGSILITTLKRKLRVNTDERLAALLGMSTPSIQQWKSRLKVTPRQLAEMVYRTGHAGAKSVRLNAIRPLVEFFPIDKQKTPQGATYQIFGSKGHRYREGLKDELNQYFGVYIFFDSRGQAIYAGKARSQTLWKEVNIAFNRDRGEVQKIKRVRHPTRQQEYRTSDEKGRQIGDHIVPLYEIASYFSAYRVSDGMIDDLEALLVRSFANNLLNSRMEQFVRSRKGVKSRK